MSTTPLSPASLSDLKAFFDQQIASQAQAQIDGTTLQIAGLDNLLNRTLGKGLQVANVTLALSTEQLKVSGLLQFLDVGFSVSVVFTLSGGKLQLELDALQVPTTSLSLNRLANRVVPQLGALPSQIPDLAVTGLHIAFQTAKPNFLFAGKTATWRLQLGPKTFDIAASVLFTPQKAQLYGQVQVGTALFDVRWQIAKGNNNVRGSWQNPAKPLTWNSIVDGLGLPTALDVPPNAPVPALQAAQLTLDLTNSAVVLSGQTAKGGAFFMAGRQDAGAGTGADRGSTENSPTRRPGTTGASWGFAFGAAVGGAWQFSQISSGLSALDFLVFRRAYLVISSMRKADFVFPNFTPMVDAPLDMVPGLNFGAAVDFAAGQGQLAKTVNRFVGGSTANIDGRIGTKMTDTRLSASLGGAINLVVPGVTDKRASNLRLINPALVLLAEPFTVEVEGTLEIPIHKDQVIDITGRFGIGPTEAFFVVDVAAKNRSLIAPFGCRGIRLDEIGVKLGVRFEPPGLDLGLEGVFRVGEAPADKCAIEFEVIYEGEIVAVNPILFYGQFASISLPTIYQAVLPQLALPPVLGSIAFKDVFIFFAEQPTVLPDNSAVAPGFAIQGELDAFNFVMQAVLAIDLDTGIRGLAAMTPINLANGAVKIGGSGRLGGPEVQFNTSSSPFFNITLDAAVLDIAAVKVNGSLGTDGFRFFLDYKIAKVLSERLQCVFTNRSNFSASCDLHFHLQIDVGPIRPPQTNLNLGTLHLNCDFAGHLDLAVNPAGIKGSVSGHFGDYVLPTMTLDASTRSLKSLPDQIIARIQNLAPQIFAPLLGDAEKWAAAVQSGLISGADNAGQVLTGFYHKSSDEVQRILKKFSLHGSTTVHIDTPGAHMDTPSKHTDAAAVHTDYSGKHVDTPGVHADVSTPHGDKKVFGKHIDAGGHQDSTFPPHGDTSTPHVDTNVTPHVDTSIPHGDVNPHVDTSNHIDV